MGDLNIPILLLVTVAICNVNTCYIHRVSVAFSFSMVRL